MIHIEKYKYNKMAANHAELLKALKDSTSQAAFVACNQWMLARNAHPLYSQLSETRTTPNDLLLLNTIHKDIEPLRIHFLEVLATRTLAWDDYYVFI